LVRQKRFPEAVEALAQAANLNPDNPRYSYVYAVALNSSGKSKEALQVLEEAHSRYPNDREILYALATLQRDQGNPFAARLYAQKLAKLAPQDPAVQQLLKQLQGQ
jgi:Flp pilus assembly protein TadD